MKGIKKQVIDWMNIQNRYPRFLKVHVRHFAFTKDLHSHLFLPTEINPKRIFTFMKKAVTVLM